ncbi:MAG: ThiF family adenylyltransferase [Steroidobacteraceae bacterium]
MNRFHFSEVALERDALAREMAHPAAGGFATFEGWVRNRNEGRAVQQLDYQAFEELGVREGNRIIEEAITRFRLVDARCVHRVGALALGDLAVWVGAASEHRAEAFAACRYIIDEVKHRLPIWKKEHYEDGDSGWVNCERCANPGHEHAHGHGHQADPAPSSFPDYSRQVALREVGEAGQRRLAAASVLVVGAGGLGCPVLACLAAAGVGTLHVVDGDQVEASNLHRQHLYTPADMGRPKAEAARERLLAMNPTLRVEAHCQRFEETNADALVALAEVVVDCSDNFRTKFLVNDAAVRAGRPAVLASIHQYEGQLQVARPDLSASCLRCLWPEATRDGLVGNCAEAGVLGPVPATLGALQAMEVMKILLDLPGQLVDHLLLVDLLSQAQRRLRVPRDGACGSAQCVRVKPAGTVTTGAMLELSLSLEDAERQGYVIIDLREAQEVAVAPLPAVAHRHWPLQALLADGPAELGNDHRYLLVCSRGLRSRAAAEAMREAGLREVYSLAGGLSAVAPGPRHVPRTCS